MCNVYSDLFVTSNGNISVKINSVTNSVIFSVTGNPTNYLLPLLPATFTIFFVIRSENV